jgi:hypothetical protein
MLWVRGRQPIPLTRFANSGRQLDEWICPNSQICHAAHAQLEKLVAGNALAEPAASGLSANLAAEQADTIPKNRPWIGAMRAEISAVDRLVGVAERHLGKSIWHDNQLVASERRAAAELREAMKAFSQAEQRHDEAGRAALKSQNHISHYVLSALRQLEKGMLRQNAT